MGKGPGPILFSVMIIHPSIWLALVWECFRLYPSFGIHCVLLSLLHDCQRLTVTAFGDRLMLLYRNMHQAPRSKAGSNA